MHEICRPSCFACRGNKSRRRSVAATRLLLTIFIDAALRAFPPPTRYPQVGLNILINELSELIAVLRVSHYTSRNTAFVMTRVGRYYSTK